MIPSNRPSRKAGRADGILPSRYRKYVYGILVAAAPLLVFYGLMTAQEVALWLGVASAAVGNGLAFANTASGKGR